MASLYRRASTHKHPPGFRGAGRTTGVHTGHQGARRAGGAGECGLHVASARKGLSQTKPCFLQNLTAVKLSSNKSGFRHKITNSSTATRVNSRAHIWVHRKTNQSVHCSHSWQGWGFLSAFLTARHLARGDSHSLRMRKPPTSPGVAQPCLCCFQRPPQKSRGKQQAFAFARRGFKPPAAEEGEPSRAVLSATQAEGGLLPSTIYQKRKFISFTHLPQDKCQKKLCFYY